MNTVDATYVCNQCGNVFTRPVENRDFDDVWNEIWTEHNKECIEERNIIIYKDGVPELLTHYEWIKWLKEQGELYRFPEKKTMMEDSWHG